MIRSISINGRGRCCRRCRRCCIVIWLYGYMNCMIIYMLCCLWISLSFDDVRLGSLGVPRSRFILSCVCPCV